MKILLLHADEFSYEAREPAVKDPEPLTDGNRRNVLREVLAALCTVEKSDGEDPAAVARRAKEEIMKVVNQVRPETVLIYPYAHLSSDLARPNVAIDVLGRLESDLRAECKVSRAPFGWYKQLSMKVKGHPLAELSKTISTSKKAPSGEAETEEKRRESQFLILSPKGVETEIQLDPEALDKIKELDREPLLKQFVVSEEVGRTPSQEPPHIKVMQKLELVDYEPASDIGHFRFYPKGHLLKRLLEEYTISWALRDLHAMTIETPLLYRLDEPDIAGQSAKFRQRAYKIPLEDRELVLRFAADFGLFRLMKDATFSYKQLPIRVFELSKSFRLEQSGECVGLRRLRAFTMPDLHSFCRDLSQGMEEFQTIQNQCTKLANAAQFDYVVAFRVVKRFYDENKTWFKKMVKDIGKSALIELIPEMKHYWVAKSEYQAIDSIGGNGQLCTVQLDVEDSERYGIYYTDADGAKKGCIIVHNSVGSLERWIYAILEQANKAKKEGKPPMLPLWLSPVHVRIIPVSQQHVDDAAKLSDVLSEHAIRSEIDDRADTLSSKIRDAETQWIPFITVLGEKEISEGNLSVRIRGEGVRRMSQENLIELIEAELSGKPKLTLNIPRQLTQQPHFR